MSAVDFTIVVLCYSTDVQGARGFYEALGLRRRVSSDTGGWEVLAGRSGGLALHATDDAEDRDPGRRTTLTLDTVDATAAAAALRERGIEAVWWDEAYGRQAGVVDPHGEVIWISEEVHDAYGYHVYNPDPHAAAVEVCAVRFSDDYDADLEFYAHFGFRPRPGGSSGWQDLDADAASGAIGLHVPPGQEHAVPGGDATDTAGEHPYGPGVPVELSLFTGEDLTAVAERVRAAGYGDPRPDDDGVLRVTDPDGRSVEIRTALS